MCHFYWKQSLTFLVDLRCSIVEYVFFSIFVFCILLTEKTHKMAYLFGEPLFMFLLITRVETPLEH